MAGDEYYYNIALQRQSEIPRNSSYMADLEFYAEVSDTSRSLLKTSLLSGSQHATTFGMADCT